MKQEKTTLEVMIMNVELEIQKISKMSDQAIANAMMAMANTVGQRVSEQKRRNAWKFHSLLVKESDKRKSLQTIQEVITGC
jgi:hypothetical protein